MWRLPILLVLCYTPCVVAGVKLFDSRREAYVRSFIPKVNDPRIQDILDNNDLVVYDKTVMPRAYQHEMRGMRMENGNVVPTYQQYMGVHWAGYNISGDAREAAKGHGNGGNGNIEFPWKFAGGTDKSHNTATFHFYCPPLDDDGKPLSIIYWWDGEKYRYVNPVGAIYGEILIMSHGGEYRTFELRIREREKGNWAVDIFRPFPTADSLSATIKRLRPSWRSDSQLRNVITHLDGNPRLIIDSLQDRLHPTESAFVGEKVSVDVLPPIGDDELVNQLLDREFSSCLGVEWRETTNGYPSYAPTTRAAWHIVPTNYDGAFIGNDRVSCMKCHESTNKHVSNFDFHRDWYGRIRGSDGIFSMHCFDRSSVSTNGTVRPVKMDKMMLNSGVFAKYNPSRHPRSIYTTIEGLE